MNPRQIVRAAAAAAALLALAPPAQADPPLASYLFPAGGRRGTAVDVRVGGLNLHSKAGFEVLGPGVEATPEVRAVPTVWFEGPILPLPDSQQAEDYPRDFAGKVTIRADAPTGPRAWRVWTAQGASGSLPFVVGDLPEVVERETDGDPVAEPVTLPLTVNGRIFPREDVDLWSFPLKAGEVLRAEVAAGKLGSKFDPWLEVLDPEGRRVAEASPAPNGSDADVRLAFQAAVGGVYTARIFDLNVKGGQSYVYRLTLTTGPEVERVFPLGGRRGSTLAFEAAGLGLPATIPPVTLSNDGAGSGPGRLAVEVAPGLPFTVDVDDLPEAVEGQAGGDTRLSAPGVGNGRIARPGEADAWSVPLVKDRNYEIDLRAARLGSSLIGVLSVLDPSGKEVAQAEGTPARGADPVLAFRPPADGVYVIKVRDRFRSRGGAAWSYRLRLAEPGTPTPDYRLHLAADTLGVPRGGSEKLRVDVDRLGGFNGPIELKVEGLPEGVTATPLLIPKDATATELTFAAAKSAPIRSTRLTVEGKADVGGAAVRRVAVRRGMPVVESVRLAVALPTPFQVTGPVDFGFAARGSVRRRKFRLKREGFDGPLEVRLADRQARHLQGVSGPVLTVPPGRDEFEYTVTLPPWMEVGRTSRSVVMATGLVREPDGTEHEVSFSSTVNDLQISAVIGPGRLGVEAGKTSLGLKPGASVGLPVKVLRARDVTGPVRIELETEGKLQGVSAAPLTLAEGQNEGVLTLTCADRIEGPPTARVLVHASARSGRDPLDAETPLTLVREP